MHSFLNLVSIVLAATTVMAAPGPNANVASRCSNAALASTKTFTVGGKDFLYTSYSCSNTVTRRGLLDPILCGLLGINCPPKPTPTPPSPPPPVNVCGAPCTLSCSNRTGILPPISDDCDSIEAAIQVFQNDTATTFTVDPNHLETLSFGTCSYFFENLGTTTLQYCWKDFSSQASLAGSTCFPPNQPFFPEGLCTAYDGTWDVGATHS